MRKLMLLMGVIMIAVQLSAQQRTLTGTVTDEKGAPIANASVLVKGTKNGTTTKQDGTYSITIANNARVLVISAIGSTDQEQNIGNKGIINVSLISSDRSLSEVVVVGYGTQRRKDATGNVATVKGSVLAEKPVQSFENALAGQAAGVQITMPSGVLNNPPVFRIRGTNSISLSSYPLIVIDGVPTYTGDQGSTNAPANPLASINPSDIESIDIAKDAASAAIYGSRAANGVVFITTKKGRGGKARINYDGWVGLTSPSRLPEILNASQYVDYKNTALANLKAIVPLTTGNFIIPNDAQGRPINTNWYNQVYHKGVSHSHSVSVSGGNEGTTYYLSTGYTDQQGILRGNEFKRMNVLLNVDSRINKVLSIGGKVAYSNEQNIISGSSGSLSGEAFSSAGIARLAFALPPNVSPYNNDGTYNIASITAIGGQGSLVNGANPYTFNNATLLINLNRSNNEVNHLQSNAYLQIKPVNWITLRTQFGIDNMLIDNDVFLNPYHGDGPGAGSGPGGAATDNFLKSKTWLWTNTAQFDYTFAEKHNISLLVGGEQQARYSTGFGINRRTLSDSAYTVIQAGFTTNNPAGSTLTQNYLLSSFGRLTYNFNKKYFLSGNIRQDEYSALGIKKGVFWGASAGWEIDQEKFWERSGLNHVFSGFKLRGSYGKVGNVAGIGDYAPYSTYTSGLYGGTATLGLNAVGNSQITWETSKKTDVGFTFGFFKDRLTGDFAVYRNNIDGLLLNVPQSPSTGLPSGIPNPPTILANIGQMYNRGIEVAINAIPIMTKNLTWTTNFNFAYNKNMVTALAPGVPEIQTTTSGLETVSKTLPGYSLGTLWVVRTGGVDPNTGRRIFVNAAGSPELYQPNVTVNYTNPDGTPYQKNGKNATISQADDGVLYANTQPKYLGGWTNTFKYRDFDLNFLFTYQFGFSIYYGSYAGLRDQRFWNNSTDVLRYWKKPGDVTDMPKPIYGDNTSNGSAYPLDVNVFKGDFVKLRTVQIGYNFPKNILDRAKISSARFYISAQNLAVITKYPGPDPEVSSNNGVTSNTASGIDRNTLANGRTITVGINIGL